MADEQPPKPQKGNGNGSPSDAPPAIVPQPLPPEAEKALEKVVQEGGAKAFLAIFGAFSRRDTYGPDPQTAQIMAEVEKHAEECRLAGYKETCKSRDIQNGRDHEYRIKRLNRETIIQIVALIASVVGAGIGIYLFVNGSSMASSS